MAILTRQEFEEATAFELFALKEYQPLVSKDPLGGSKYDLRARVFEMTLAVNFSETTVNETKAKFRPLLVGAAWKVLDLIVEASLDQAGLTPSNKSTRWAIKEKAKRAKNGDGSLPPLSSEPQLWTQLGATYSALQDARHCLVHRSFEIGADGAITSVRDEKGYKRPDVTVTEQEALIAIAQRASKAVLEGGLTSRSKGDLFHHLNQLQNHHRMTPLPSSEVREVVVVIVDAEQSENLSWKFDPTIILGRIAAIAPNRHYDLELHFPGTEFRPLIGELEDMPGGLQSLDPKSPPSWIHQ